MSEPVPIRSSQTTAAGTTLARPPTMQRHQLRTVVIVAAAATVVPFLYGGAYHLSVANLVITYAIAAVGFYLVFGISGQFAFSHAAFFGLGAYSFVWASRGVGFWPGLLIGTLITSLVALVFAWTVRRANHFYFAIATLGLSEIALLVFREWRAFTGLGGEVAVPHPPSIFGFEFDTEFRMYWFLLVCAAVALALMASVERSPLRREAIAMRDHPEVASSVGVPILRVRLVTFVLGSAYAGAAGALFAADQGFISPESFGVALGMNIFLMVILGGIRNMWGAVIGAAFVVLLPEWLRTFAEYRELVFAILLVGTILLLPEGLVGIRQAWKRWTRRA